MARCGENIILTGFMGSGKTTVGRVLARRLGWRFMDLDRVIEREAGASVAAIFRTRGEVGFRRLESRAIRSLRHLSRRVVATGGGAPVSLTNRAELKVAGSVVYLRASVGLLVCRLRRETGRPLLAGAGGDTRALRRVVAGLLKKRARHYRKADMTVRVGAGESPACLAGRIACWFDRAGRRTRAV